MPALRLCYKVRMTSYPEECRDMPQKTKFWESFSLNETGSNRCIHPDLTGEKLTEKNGLWRRFMKYIKQFAIIITFSFAGEVLRALLPLPVPASIYGLVLMRSGTRAAYYSAGFGKRYGKISGGSNAADVYSGCCRADGILG